MIHGMSEPAHEQKLIEALNAVATLGDPIKKLTEAIGKLTEKIGELVPSPPNNQPR